MKTTLLGAAVRPLPKTVDDSKTERFWKPQLSDSGIGLVVAVAHSKYGFTLLVKNVDGMLCGFSAHELSVERMPQ